MTAMLGTAIPALWHWCRVWQAWSSTHSRRGRIMPVRSALGITTSGMTQPRSGWCQRSGALLCAAHPAPLLVPDGQLP